MLVKKINPEWRPSENRDLKVGEIRDVTYAKDLILNGDVVAVDDQGNEISAYELYGEIIPSERREFEEWLRIKRATAYKAKLEQEQDQLKSALNELKKPEETNEKAVDEVLRAKRIAILAKARAARKYNKK